MKADHDIILRRSLEMMTKEYLVDEVLNSQIEISRLKSDLYDLHDQIGTYDMAVENSTEHPHGSFIFYLGAHEPSWLRHIELVGIPLFVSTRRLGRLKNMIPATTRWALDSGGFTELTMHGKWTVTPQEYITQVRRYHDEIGMMDWAAPQDWMCEPHMLERTGLTVEKHQENTISNYLDLKTLAPELPFIPVLQGWTRDDYLRHVQMYMEHDIDLEAENLIGLGSVCRRQASDEVATIATSLHPLRLHGFGAKKAAIVQYGSVLASADSMAWTVGGRKRPDPSCPKRTCGDCLHYALKWRNETIRGVNDRLVE